MTEKSREAAGGRAQRRVNLEPVASLCAAGDCPTVYRTDRNTVVVQGYTLDGAGITVPAGEGLVEIPSSLLEIAASELTRR